MRSINFILTFAVVSLTCSTTYTSDSKKPTVLIAILVRNKGHALPYFLSFFERLEYPKERIHLWIRSDNNVDNTIEVLNAWLKGAGKDYHAVDVDLDEKSSGFQDEDGIADWSEERFLRVISLREEALNYGRKAWADFVWMLDADVLITNPMTLENLVSKNRTVVAPLLKSDGMYSNFWAGMTEDYYYLRTDRYKPILFREEIGCFDVPMIHSAVLIDLRKISSNRLTYEPKNLPRYDGPTDDIITFAIGANQFEIPLFICNDNVYGFVTVPLEKGETIEEDLQRLMNVKVEILAQDDYLPLSTILERYTTYPAEDTLELDNIYMINLLRRPERWRRMHRLFTELGIRAEVVDAVDGRNLDEFVLKDLGVTMMPEYSDPYHERPMTMGEVGCFLSHYAVWKKVMDSGHERVMVLEDDVSFEPFFRQKIGYLLAELENLRIDWDLIYLGRKKLVKGAEPLIGASKYLVRAEYSYWTLGYLLSASGAKKLVEAMPLKKLVPVDEYLPILSDVHPREEWKVQYPNRNLIILSSNPLLIHPTHYTGDDGYISDTENSHVAFDQQQANGVHKREEL